MPSSTEPRSGLSYAWAVADNFAAEMDANLLKIGRVGFHLSVLDRDLSAPPGAPAAGDTYIVSNAIAATGDWTGHEKDVAIWDGAAWVFYPPRTGWVAFIEDEMKLAAYYSAAWSAGVSL